MALSNTATPKYYGAFREAVLRVKSDALDREIASVTDPSRLMDLLREKQDLKHFEII